MMSRYMAFCGLNLMLQISAARVQHVETLDAEWGWTPPVVIPAAAPAVSAPVLESLPMGQIAGASAAAQSALEKAQQLAELAAKLAQLIEAVKQAGQASTAGSDAVATVGRNFAAITKTIGEAKYEPLFDGQWTQEDMPVLKDVALYLKIVDTVLATTGELNGVSTAFVKIIDVLTAVVDLLKAVEELAPAAGTTEVAVLEGLSGEAAAVAQQCDAEVKKISAAETKLRPPLNEYEAASGMTKGVVVAKNFDAFKTGFEDVGTAWISVNAFFNDKLKPAIEKTVSEVGKLKGNVEAYQLPSR